MHVLTNRLIFAIAGRITAAAGGGQLEFNDCAELMQRDVQSGHVVDDVTMELIRLERSLVDHNVPNPYLR